MPELRKDPIIGRWVIISSERARRPGNFVDTSDKEDEDEERECSMCNNDQTAITLDSNSDIRVVHSNGVKSGSNLPYERCTHGLYDVIKGFGAHEIVIETPEHIANMADLNVQQIASVFKMYASRIRELEKDERFQFALAYKNYGSSAGESSVGHTRSHIVATPVWPLRVKEKLIGARQYFQDHGRCIYCDQIAQEQKDNVRIVCETDHYIAVIPFAARFLFEMMILPKNHNCDYVDGLDNTADDLAKIMKLLLKKLQQDLDDPSYNFVIQTAPFRRTQTDHEKWKTIKKDYHWHIELMPRITRIAGFEIGTGFYICSIPPEQMAEFLRGDS